jgi:hypothetical protein
MQLPKIGLSPFAILVKRGEAVVVKRGEAEAKRSKVKALRSTATVEELL